MSNERDHFPTETPPLAGMTGGPSTALRPGPVGEVERATLSQVSEPDERGVNNPAVSTRPSLTLSEAASVCGVSRSTIRRKHEAGDFPNAFKSGPDNAWRIPVTDLLGAGLNPGRPSPPDEVSEPDERVRAETVIMPRSELEGLKEQLTYERHRASVAEARLSERGETVSALKEALSEARQRAIEAAPAVRQTPAAVVDVRDPNPSEPSRTWWGGRRKERRSQGSRELSPKKQR